MTEITGNEPAQPFFEYNENGYGEAVVFTMADGSKQFLPYKKGLTIRQEFAARAMEGMLSSGRLPTLEDHKKIAESSVKHADYLIAELNKQKNKNQ